MGRQKDPPKNAEDSIERLRRELDEDEPEHDGPSAEDQAKRDREAGDVADDLADFA